MLNDAGRTVVTEKLSGYQRGQTTLSNVACLNPRNSKAIRAGTDGRPQRREVSNNQILGHPGKAKVAMQSTGMSTRFASGEQVG